MDKKMKLTYIQQSGSNPPVGDGGDQYTGLDRFGRIIDQRWIKASSGADLERVKYGYSEASNRVWRQNTVAEGLSANQDEYYTYDGLYQIKTLQRGTLTGTPPSGISGTPTWEEDWNYDATGNWHGSSSAYLTKVSGTPTLNQNRTHNEVNEITNITESTGTAWPTPGHDAAGNLTSVPQPLSLGNGYTLTWDAWNRLMTVKAGSTMVATYAYDGATRRVSKNDGTNTRNYYYSDQWQVLEERLNSSTSEDRQFVWGILSIDDLILRDNGSTRKYALKDAMGSVTAIVDTSGTVQERYGYSGFGIPRYMTANFGNRTSSSYDWETLFDGYRYDTDTGLYQVRYRYLHPNLGRWISRDPLEQLEFETLRRHSLHAGYDSPAKLQESANLHWFVVNDPVAKYDSDGRVVLILICVVVLGVTVCSCSKAPEPPPNDPDDCWKDSNKHHLPSPGAGKQLACLARKTGCLQCCEDKHPINGGDANKYDECVAGCEDNYKRCAALDTTTQR